MGSQDVLPLNLIALLSRGLFFQYSSIFDFIPEYDGFSSPLSRTFFNMLHRRVRRRMRVFVPSLGDFFSIFVTVAGTVTTTLVFVPSLGDFFSIANPEALDFLAKQKFSSPLSGTFFQCGAPVYSCMWDEKFVFVPSLGDFFSITMEKSGFMGNIERFSSPFSGTFFQ